MSKPIYAALKNAITAVNDANSMRQHGAEITIARPSATEWLAALRTIVELSNRLSDLESRLQPNLYPGTIDEIESRATPKPGERT